MANDRQPMTEIGAVWVTTIQNGEHAGEKMISATLGPPFDNYALVGFKNDKRGNDRAPDFRLYLQRKQTRAQEQSAPSGGSGFDDDDGDPFAEE